MQLVTVPHYKTGEPLPIGSTTAEHHPYWPRHVFHQPLYRGHRLNMRVDEHDEFHAYFNSKCRMVFANGAFLCHECPEKYAEVCGWGCMILAHSVCRLPADCPTDCILRYTCLEKALQLQIHWE